MVHIRHQNNLKFLIVVKIQVDIKAEVDQQHENSATMKDDSKHSKQHQEQHKLQ